MVDLGAKRKECVGGKFCGLEYFREALHLLDQLPRLGWEVIDPDLSQLRQSRQGS